MRTFAVVKRIIRQFFRDKRTLALMIIAPIFVLTLMDLVFTSGEKQFSIGVYEAPTPFVEALEDFDIDVTAYENDQAKDHILDDNLDAFVTFELMSPTITLEGTNPNDSKAILNMIQKAISSLSNQPNASIEPDIQYIYGSDDMSFFDYIGPVLIGFFIFFFVFLIAGVSFLRERTSGTLERLLATPIRRHELVFGYVIGFGLFTAIQATLISGYAIRVLDMMLVGSFWYVLLITLLLAMTALTLGTLLSAFANNELQMIQFIPLVIVPQVFFSGLFPLDAMADWLASFSVIMPLTYGANALREIMIRGNGFESFQQDVYILLAFSVVFIILNVIVLKRYRRL
ncbi:ABC transporter permease [Bacillus alveayuensis]|uniref:ABC transporter permease n=1 Tax=Aeribacillus alveayuensis TaxID=279215 RepID=UPI0005CC9A88|nr:ABC transporter permease [Bacillus alveayuensis]